MGIRGRYGDRNWGGHRGNQHPNMPEFATKARTFSIDFGQSKGGKYPNKDVPKESLRYNDDDEIRSTEIGPPHGVKTGKARDFCSPEPIGKNSRKTRKKTKKAFYGSIKK